jgi:hypothetical protein
MSVTLTDIKNRFPALYDQAKAKFKADVFITLVLEEITPLIDFEFWKTYTDIVIKLTVAHNLELETQKYIRKGNTGLETSRSVVGQYSVSYAAPILRSIEDSFKTQYSIEIDRIRDSISPQFIVHPLTTDSYIYANYWNYYQ